MIYLGYIVSQSGVATDLEKVATVRDWPIPKGAKELQAFLGTIMYYRLYLKDFAMEAKSLHQLTAKGANWNWDEKANMAFMNLKKD